MKRLLFLFPVLLMVSAANLGCQTANMNLLNKSPMNLFSKKETEAEKPVPVRMAVIWKDAIYEDVGKPKTRGMGGRIYFYDEKNQPVEAFGELIVYGFDDSKSDSEKKPKKFVFPENEFQNYLSKSDLGSSYSVWIPWDEAGGIRKAISLIPIFKTSEGQLLKSGQTLCTLPGRAPKPGEFNNIDDRDPHIKTFHNNLYQAEQASNDRLNNSYVQQASAVDANELVNQVGSQSATVSYQARKRKIRTSTINLSKSLSDRIKQLPAQAQAPTQPVSAPVQKMDDIDRKLQQHQDLMKKHLEAMRKQKSAKASSENAEPQKKKPLGLGRNSDPTRTPATVAKFPTQRPVFGKPGEFN